MWAEEATRLALLELLVSASGLPRRKSQAAAWEHLLEVGWARRTRRRDVLRLANGPAVEELLDRVWPEWREVWSALQREGLTPDERGLRELARRARESALAGTAWPTRLNRRTALAAVAAHSKATLTPLHRQMLAEVTLTRDGLVRLRPHAGLCLQKGSRTLSGDDLVDLAGEVVVTERALHDGTRLAGPLPRAVLSVENRGPYVDLPLPEGWLAVHVAGWDTSTLGLLSDHYLQVPWYHFGDLDPNGVAIFRHLQTIRAGMRWLVPEFWAEHPGQACVWPEGLVLPEDPPLLQELAATGRWLEQEVLVLDGRLKWTLESV